MCRGIIQLESMCTFCWAYHTYIAGGSVIGFHVECLNIGTIFDAFVFLGLSVLKLKIIRCEGVCVITYEYKWLALLSLYISLYD